MFPDHQEQVYVTPNYGFIHGDARASAVAQSPGQVHRRLRVSLNPGDHGKPGSHRQRLEWKRR
jgi:hypothetical protein